MEDSGSAPYSEAKEGWRMRRPRDLAVVALPLTLFVAAVSFIGAFATSHACDVTRVAPVLPKFQADYQTGYCRLAHFPGFPDTFKSGLFVAGVWGLPLIAAMAGSIAAIVTNRPPRPWLLGCVSNRGTVGRYSFAEHHLGLHLSPRPEVGD